MSKGARKTGAIGTRGEGCMITGDIPETTQGMVLVRVAASLISAGTELGTVKYLRANPSERLPEPKAFGYQNSGVVLEVGEGVTEFKPGDRVACMGNKYALHSNYALVPKNLCAALPDNVSFEEGAFAHLAMTSLHALRRGEPELGEYLLVVGLGLVGQLAARLGQLAGMYVMGWDTVAARCDMARAWGIDDAVAIGGKTDPAAAARQFTRGLGFDMSVLAIGGDGTQALESITQVMKVSTDGHVMGRVCLVGMVTTTSRWGAALGNLDLRCCARTGPGYHDQAWETGEREYPRTFMRWHTKSNMELVLRLMSEGKLDVRGLITHRVPLEKIDDVINVHVDHPERALGTVLLYEHHDA